MCASQLISRYLTAVTARVFLSSKESKNKNATSQLEADYITAIGNLEYAAIPAYLERLIENDEAARAAAAHVDEGSASGLVVGGTGVRRLLCLCLPLSLSLSLCVCVCLSVSLSLSLSLSRSLSTDGLESGFNGLQASERPRSSLNLSADLSGPPSHNLDTCPPPSLLSLTARTSESAISMATSFLSCMCVRGPTVYLRVSICLRACVCVRAARARARVCVCVCMCVCACICVRVCEYARERERRISVAY